MPSNVAFDTKLGLAGLGVNLNQSVTASLKVWYTDTVAFGLDNGDFYIDTGNSNLSLHVNVAVDTGSTFQGSVGLLQFIARPASPAPTRQAPDCRWSTPPTSSVPMAVPG